MARVGTQEEVIKELCKLLPDSAKPTGECTIYSLTARTIRIDIPVNSVQLRTETAKKVMGFFDGATVTKDRPFDVKLPGGYTILVKPAKAAKKVGSSAYYGHLASIDLSAFNLSGFSTISREFASGNLVTNIKEASDVKCVTELNEAIVKASPGPIEGIPLKIHGITFNNVIGVIPVTNGEPKADVVLVCKKGNVLYPDCYISYKMGTSAKDFQNYSGLSEKSSRYIFAHEETLEFYKLLANLSELNIKEDVFRVIKDPKIIGLSVWGSDYGKSSYGINNCHFIAQGSPSISGSTLSYDHSQKNGDLTFTKEYQPVFGARYASKRGNIGPGGLRVDNFRIGIFPRAYRAKWLT